MKRHIIPSWINIAIYSTIIVGYIAFDSNAEQNSVTELEDLLMRLEKRHGDTRTLAARFRQEKRFFFMDKPVISQGFILFSSPNRIRFDITEPFQTALLCDDKNMKRHELTDGRWRSMQFSGGSSIRLVMDQIAQWMQGKFSKQRSLFAFSVNSDDPNDYVSLDLEPRHKQFRQYIEKIRIHIAKPPEYRITRIDIFEPKGDRFALIFVQEIFNQELPKDCFSKPQTAIRCKELFLQGQTNTPKKEGKKEG